MVDPKHRAQNSKPTRMIMSSLLNRFLLLLVLAGPALLPGCASNKNAAENITAKNATIYVEGRHRGVTPATLSVFRNRGEYEIKLVKDGEVVRRYELSAGGDGGPERHLLNMDLQRDQSGLGFRTFDLDDFESFNDTLYVVPYISETISIDDEEYGLILVVTD